MRLAIVLAVSLAVCLPAVADDSTSRTCPHPRGPAARGSGCVAGFELGLPPDGWTQEIAVPTHTWTAETMSPYEGSTHAYVPWQDGEWQAEWLKFNYTPTEGDILEFATMGDPDYTPNANFIVEINNIVKWNFNSDHTVGAWEWEHVALSLDYYAGEDIEIAFGYVGHNGADHYLDGINVHSFDMAVSDVEIVWHDPTSFSIYPTLPVSSCLSHDDVEAELVYSIDSDVVLEQTAYYAGSFFGGCYGAAYPDCYEWCPDLGTIWGSCTDEYIGAGYFRCKCHWYTNGDDPTIYNYTGQSEVTVSIDLARNGVVESDETNNILTVPLVPPTPVEGMSWSTVKALYR